MVSVPRLLVNHSRNYLSKGGYDRLVTMSHLKAVQRIITAAQRSIDVLPKSSNPFEQIYVQVLATKCPNNKSKNKLDKKVFMTRECGHDIYQAELKWFK